MGDAGGTAPLGIGWLGSSISMLRLAGPTSGSGCRSTRRRVCSNYTPALRRDKERTVLAESMSIALRIRPIWYNNGHGNGGAGTTTIFSAAGGTAAPADHAARSRLGEKHRPAALGVHGTTGSARRRKRTERLARAARAVGKRIRRAPRGASVQP